MKAHTQAFKDNVCLFGRELDSKITYTIDGADYELGSEELNSVSPHYEGAILKSVMKQLDIDSNVQIPLNAIINYQFGVKIGEDIETGNNVYDYIDFGNYIVYNVEKQEDTNSYKITCYDKMLYSMINYKNMNLTYPITIREYITFMCSFLGLDFGNKNDEFPNFDKVIESDLFLSDSGEDLGFTFRDVFDQLAQVTASTICINDKTDKLELRYINDTNDTIDEEFLKNINVNFGEKYGPINTIVLSRSAESDKINQSIPEDLSDDEKIAIEIKDNQFMNFNNRDEFIPDILNKLYGLEYYVNDFSSTGITYYNLCDRYNVKIGENTYSCIMFNDEVNVTQGLEENIYTEMPEESVTDYTKSDKTDNRINQAYIIVNKQIGEITARVSDVEGNYSQISQTVNGLSSDVIKNTEGIENLRNQIDITARGIEIALSKSGNNILMGTELYDLSQWGWLEYFRIYEGTMTPSTSEYDFFYNTSNNIVYENQNGSWIATSLTRGEIPQQNRMNVATIIENETTKNNLLSKRLLNVVNTSIRPTIIDNTKNYLTFSCKIQNTLDNGKFVLKLFENLYQNPDITQIDKNVLFYTKEFEVGEYTNLNDFTFTIPIIKSSSIVKGVVSSGSGIEVTNETLIIPDGTVDNYILSISTTYITDYVRDETYVIETGPENSRYWLYTGGEYAILKEFVSSEWKNVEEPKVFYDIINEVYYIPNIENDLIYYTQANYEEYITKSIYGTLKVINGTGNVFIGDVKLEYGTTATDWSNNQNEIYGKNYKMDDEGFEIKSGEYTMHIDEDEVSGYYKETLAFQLNEYNTYSKVGVFEETNQNGLVTKKLSNNFYVRYIK
ncbi:MAG: hypothetical protein IJ690_02070 [Clostridia bacterium]|nr:hypothetical protein [Clostridia bacterium]MBR1653728.1 hypothetical protein [Clostridia bacterium]